jgi:hypothetical protein
MLTSAAVCEAHCRLSAVGGNRLRTIRIGAPQHLQSSGGRGLLQAATGAGLTFSTTFNSAIK